MSGERPGPSDHDAGWWSDGAPQQEDAFHVPEPGRPAERAAQQAGQRAGQPAGPRPGGRADARRAQQGRGPGADGLAVDGGRAAAKAAAARGNGRGKKKGNRKKVVIWTTVGALGVIAATSGAIYFKLNGNITTFASDGLSKDRPAAATADANGNTPVNVLLIGSDSRGGDNKNLGGGGDAGARSDTTILLHVYADHKHAVGISIPRDALVSIPPCKLPNGSWTKAQTNVMFNSAFAVGDTEQGNPACTQNALEQLTNLRIDHTIVVNFEGFATMTSAIGGIPVCMPNAIYEGDLDPNLGHKGNQIFAKGEQTVSGQQALDYVRLRHGVGDGSDIGRMKRQQAFLSSLIKSVKSKGMDPTTLLPLADAATKSLVVDKGLGSAASLMSFALSMKSIDLHNIKFITTPWKYEGPRVALVHPDTEQLFAALRADRTLDGQDASGGNTAPASPPTTQAAPTPADAPADPGTVKGAGIRVAVYNGTTTTGLTGKAAGTLKASKFTVTSMGNAASQTHATTVVQYGPGEKAAAQTVAALFPGATVEAATRAGVSLVLGQDYADGGGSGGSGGAGPASAAAPGPLPSSVSAAARSADDDPCANVSYG
ncbi:LCP family protein [Kitasatospora sp. MAP5-34]|uniref:LCP family protein n=1 Tax=Kitasatospora sp. MAP5-34 TaxID=3035102 RepID=UPI002475E251|nr:LCP family protein [Kitasatospora sp. MAP5-34]MDH6577460.1 LCP family protein required for cell wall assembly [Kitasatospora sp. MAP5-34]